MSYNIRKAVGLDWRRDPLRIAEILLEIDADVVILQEADRRTGARAGILPLDLLSERGGYERADLAIRPQSHGWHGNVLLARRGLGLSEPTRIDLPVSEPRGAVSCFLAAKGIAVIGTHLSLLPPPRRKQLRALHDHATRASHPVLIGGDFNAFGQTPRAFEGDWQHIRPGPSFHAARPRIGLDRFLLAGEIGYSRAWVHHSKRAARASDHLPVVIDLKI